MSIQRIMASAFTPRRIDVALHNISAARVCALAFNVKLPAGHSQTEAGWRPLLQAPRGGKGHACAVPHACKGCKAVTELPHPIRTEIRCALYIK